MKRTNAFWVSIIFSLWCLPLLFPNTTFAYPGQLDLSFGNQGTISVFGSNNFFARRIRQQTDGNLLFFGNGLQSKVIIRRTNLSGSFDESFGDFGFAVEYRHGGQLNNPLYLPAWPQGQVWDGIIQQDGKIVAIGSSPDSGVERPTIWRFTPDGVYDPTFGTNGKLFLSTLAGKAVSIDIRGSNLYVAYYTSSGSYLSKRNSGGGPDINFGTFGTVILPSSPYEMESLSEVSLIQSSGKVLFAAGPTFRRYNSNGSLDSSFGIFGNATLPDTNVCSGYEWFRISSIQQYADGRILVAGALVRVFPPTSYYYQPAIIRYSSSGFKDMTFNNGSLVCGEQPAFSGSAIGRLQPDGRILLATKQLSSNRNLVRLFSSGMRDFTYYSPQLEGSTIDILVQQHDTKTVVAIGNRVERYLP